MRDRVGRMTYVDALEALGEPASGTDPLKMHETKGERTRRRLLEQAITRFGEHGYRSTSVSEVARSIGLTQAATYAYFDSKTELYRAAADADAEALIEGARAGLESLPARAMLPALIAGLVSGLDDHPLAKHVLAGQDQESLDRLIALPILEAVVYELADLLRAEQATGTVRGDIDPDLMARGVQAILFGLVMSSAQLTGPVRPEVIEGVLHAIDSLVWVSSAS